MTNPGDTADQAPDEDVAAFAFSDEDREDYKFAVSTQMSVLLMGLLSAALVVLLVAGLELSLRYAIASGWIDAPPTPRFYADLINQP